MKFIVLHVQSGTLQFALENCVLHKNVLLELR